MRVFEDPCLLAFTACCTEDEYYISWMRLRTGLKTHVCWHLLCVVQKINIISVG